MRGYMLPGEGESAGLVHAQEGAVEACVSLLQVEQYMGKGRCGDGILSQAFLFRK